MFRIFIVLVLIIGASSGVLFTNTYLAFQQSKTNLMERDRIVLRDIRNQLIQSIIKDESSGLLMLPFGENIENEHVLPSWLFVPRMNPFGNQYLYCPFGETEGGYNNHVNMGDGGSYEVALVANNTTSGNDYVLHSSGRVASNVLGIIISNHDSQNKINCSDIDSPNNNYFNNSLVEVIYKDSVLYNDLLQERYFNIGSEDEANSVLGIAAVSINDRTVFNFTESMAIEGQVFNNNSGEKRIVKFTSPSQDIKTIGSLSNIPVSLEFNNMDVYFEDIILSSSIRVVAKNSNLTFRNAQLSQFKLINSTFDKIESTINNQSLTGDNRNTNIIESYNSEIRIYNSGNINISYTPAWIHNSNISIIGSSFNMGILNNQLGAKPMYGLNLLSGSTLYIEDSDISFNITGSVPSVFNYDTSSAINIAASYFVNGTILFSGDGLLTSYNSIYSGFNTVFEGLLGSRLKLIGNTIDASIGIVDDGITLLSGFDNQIGYDIACIQGNLGDGGILLKDDFEYDAVTGGNYMVMNNNIFLPDKTRELSVDFDLTHLYRDFDLDANCGIKNK